MRLLLAALALLLASCATCRCPAYDTAVKVAERDFSRRADPSLLACTVGDYRTRVRVVRPKD